ncbi:MAG: selenium-dependent molybdenum cofactor biosynthesis protein YqeB [Chloroflexota bacterium]
MSMELENQLVVVRGGGDLATGIIYRLHKAGFPVVVLELPRPLVVRRRVAVAAAIVENEVKIEGMTARHITAVDEAVKLAKEGIIPVMPSPNIPEGLHATILIDARMAKRNIDTHLDQAQLVIALGPGFSAGIDCHVVIETKRGHRLGRVIWEGAAIPDTGTPGLVAGKGAERVLRAPCEGTVSWQVEIGDVVKEDQTLGTVTNRIVKAPFNGVVRGLIMDGLTVRQRQKIGDVDARADVSACFTISDKALSIAGGVMEAIFTVR